MDIGWYYFELENTYNRYLYNNDDNYYHYYYIIIIIIRIKSKF